ncbi:MAG: hypothetical protein IJY36_03285 [Coprobacter sp.]|nr:hypothetical protein [Coprobacter sp.]
MKKIIFGGILLLCIGFTSCRTASISSYYQYETECLGDQLDGSILLRVKGQGISRNAAINAAEKQAVNDIMFSGVKRGQCTFVPLLKEVNAREKYRTYFESLFSGNDYDKYVRIAPRNKLKKVAMKDGTVGTTYLIVLKVFRTELEQKLISDNIIK